MPDGSDVLGEAKTYVLASRSNIDIDIADLLVAGRMAVYAHVLENPELLTMSFIRSKVRLSAGKFIGLIPVAPGIMVDVRPKLPISNLAHILDVAMHPIRSIAGIERTYLETDLESDSVVDFLTANFLRAIREIQSAGWLKAYVERTETTSHPRGRIDLAGTLKTSWSRGAMHHVHSSSFRQTSDVPENRLLRHVLEFLLLSRADHRSDRNITASANDLLNAFPAEIGPLRHGDRARCETVVDRRSLSPTRAYYYRSLEIGLMVLAGKGISFQGYGTDITLETSIIDFETAFENYVRRVLQRDAGNSVIVKNGNQEGGRPLYDDRRDPPAQPDIVVMPAAGGAPVVADVKYKDYPARPDVNQVVTYAVVYRAKRVVLIHQSKPGARKGLSLRGTISSVQVYDYAIDLDTKDLTAEENKMAVAVFSLLQ